MTSDEDAAIEAEVLGPEVVSLQSLKLRLAAQVAPARWRSSVQHLAEQLDAGCPLEEAHKQKRLPKELSCLLGEAVRLPDPATFLLDAFKARAEVRASWQAFISLILYPALLLVFAVFIGLAFSYSVQGLVDFAELESFGLTGFEAIQSNIEDQHAAMVGLAMVIGWIALVLVSIAIAGPPWASTAVLGGFAMIGRPLRWIALQEILHRCHLFAEQGVVDARMGQAVANSFSRSSQSVVAESIARRVDGGMAIGRSLAASMLSDGLCRPALLLLDQRDSQTAQTFLQTAQLLGRMAEQRCRVLATILPVFLLALVGTVVWATLTSYFLAFRPLVTMISLFS